MRYAKYALFVLACMLIGVMIALAFRKVVCNNYNLMNEPPELILGSDLGPMENVFILSGQALDIYKKDHSTKAMLDFLRAQKGIDDVQLYSNTVEISYNSGQKIAILLNSDDVFRGGFSSSADSTDSLGQIWTRFMSSMCDNGS